MTCQHGRKYGQGKPNRGNGISLFHRSPSPGGPTANRRLPTKKPRLFGRVCTRKNGPLPAKHRGRSHQPGSGRLCGGLHPLHAHYYIQTPVGRQGGCDVGAHELRACRHGFLMLIVVAALGAAGVQRHLHRHAPAAFLVGLDQPVRHHHHRLVDQLEPALRLADRLDRGRSRNWWAATSSGPRPMPSHSSVRPRPKTLSRSSFAPSWPSRLAVDVREVPPVGVGGQAGEVHLDGEMQRPALRQVFQQVGDLQRRTAGVERQALGDPQRDAAALPSRSNCTWMRSGLRRMRAS